MSTHLPHHMIGGSIDSTFSVWASCIDRLKQAGNTICIETVGYECAECWGLLLRLTVLSILGWLCCGSWVDGAVVPGLMALCPGMMVLSILGLWCCVLCWIPWVSWVNLAVSWDDGDECPGLMVLCRGLMVLSVLGWWCCVVGLWCWVCRVDGAVVPGLMALCPVLMAVSVLD